MAHGPSAPYTTVSQPASIANSAISPGIVRSTCHKIRSGSAYSDSATSCNLGIISPARPCTLHPLRDTFHLEYLFYMSPNPPQSPPSPLQCSPHLLPQGSLYAYNQPS